MSARTKGEALAMAIVVTLAACARAEKGGKGEPPATVPMATTTAVAQPVAPVIAQDPFALGTCELSVDGAPAKKYPGGGSNIASRHWAVGPQRSRVEILLLNCGRVDLSTATNSEGDYPMRPGKFAIRASSDKPGEFVSSTIPGAKGELKIDAWDKSSIKGSFELTGNPDGHSTRYQGTFQYKCPPTLACK